MRPDYPVVRNDRGEWVLLRHDLVWRASLDDTSFSSAVSRFAQVPNGLDGSAHTAVRVQGAWLGWAPELEDRHLGPRPTRHQLKKSCDLLPNPTRPTVPSLQSKRLTLQARARKVAEVSELYEAYGCADPRLGDAADMVADDLDALTIAEGGDQGRPVRQVEAAGHAVAHRKRPRSGGQA